MKTLFALLFCAAFFGACATTDGVVVRPSEITRTEIVVDSVLNPGVNAGKNIHSYLSTDTYDKIEPHKWNLCVTEYIPSDTFLADNFKGIRTCTVCGRKEAVHDTTWSEAVK